MEPEKGSLRRGEVWSLREGSLRRGEVWSLREGRYGA